MSTTSPRSSENAIPEGPSAGGSAEARIATLRAEVEASADRSRQALILYEIGHLMQFGLGNEAQAVREYLSAYNLDPSFRLPLIALVQIFERRRSTKNLTRLYEAEARSATTPREAASAMTDRGLLMGDLGDADGAIEVIRDAFSQAAEAADIALILEHELLGRGEEAEAMEIAEARADLVTDPVLATLLRLEVARSKHAAGDVDGALATLRQAVGTSAARWRILSELERVARSDDRWPELVVALEGRAKLAAMEARGEEHGQHSGAFSVQRFASQERAAGIAAALYAEAGRLRMTRLGDPASARGDFASALALRPDDAALQFERMLACELAGDLDGAADQARVLLEGVSGPDAAALRFRLAERALGDGDTDAALDALRAARADDPGSAVIAATYDDLVRGVGDVAAAVKALAAASGEPAARAQRLWEAATLAARELNDAEGARVLFTQAAEAAEDATPILREAFAVALSLGDADGARAHGDALLARDLEDAERSALLRDLYELNQVILEDRDAAASILEQALASPAASWAGDTARLRGALDGNDALLAKAHEALAARAMDAETAAAHLCAAARAKTRGGDDEGAVETLRAALAKSPTHPYAVALLEEVLRARGDAEQVVRLLREAAEKADAPRAAETQLLLAGAAAEAADDHERAVQAYDEAASRDPTSLAPMLALRRLAENKNDRALLLRALEGLSERERSASEPGRHTLALGEHLDLFDGKPAEAERALRLALGAESTALHAAVDLALLPIGGDAHARLDGLERMLGHASEEARPGILREAAGAALREGDVDAASRLLNELTKRAPHDRWAPLGWLRLGALRRAAPRPVEGAEGAGEPDPAEGDDATALLRAERAEAWMSLGRATDDAEVSAELLLQGLRAQVFGLGEDASDDAVLVAHDILATAPESIAGAIAMDESLRAGDDPDGRADALGSILEHAFPSGDGPGRLGLEAARGRALAAAGRSREALEVLLRVAVTDPDDLASWEAIRVCARDCDAWEPLVEACDRLAHLLDDDELVMLLLEESAATLMDELKQDDRAERRLRRVLAIDARRPIAYGRLHDLLAEREDDEGLLELVSNRIELVDSPEELTGLFYEQARLLRSLSLREEALGSLDNLLMLDGDHLGGLALLVELQVQLENWGGAVEALRSLAGAADVPGTQQRIARLGAADFLQNKLGDLEGALGELTALHEAGLADLEIYERAATVAVELEQAPVAAEMLARAVELAPSPSAVATLERRAGRILAEAGMREAATQAYERALAAAPTDLAAGQALARLLDAGPREAMSRRFETAARRVLDADPTDSAALRLVLAAAEWRADEGLRQAVLDVLSALGEGTDEELAAITPRASTPRGVLDDTGLARVRYGLAPGPVMELAGLVAESAAEMDGLTPSGFGLGRGDQVADSPLKAELSAICQAFGLPAPDVFVGGPAEHLLDIAPYHKDRVTMVAGTAVVPPLNPDQRFTVGLLAYAARLGLAPFVRRGPGGAATVLFAAAAAAEVPLPLGEGRAGMAEGTRRIYKAMPRRVRKAIPPVVAAIGGDGRDLIAWGQQLHHSASRAGLLIANDFATGLRRAIGTTDPEVVAATPEAIDILLFWLSPEVIDLRRRLGLSA